jgi:hypothetical protein
MMGGSVMMGGGGGAAVVVVGAAVVGAGVGGGGAAVVGAGVGGGGAIVVVGGALVVVGGALVVVGGALVVVGGALVVVGGALVVVGGALVVVVAFSVVGAEAFGPAAAALEPDDFEMPATVTPLDPPAAVTAGLNNFAIVRSGSAASAVVGLVVDAFGAVTIVVDVVLVVRRGRVVLGSEARCTDDVDVGRAA